MTRARTLLVGAVVGHLGSSVVHGLVHLAIPVHVHGWQYGYTATVILLAPIVGITLITRSRASAGGWLLILSGVAAFAFEGLYHFAIANPDHVTAVTNGRVPFTQTAVLTTIGDATLVAVSAWFLYHLRGGQHEPAVKAGLD